MAEMKKEYQPIYHESEKLYRTIDASSALIWAGTDDRFYLH
jgi:hypothetical protein